MHGRIARYGFTGDAEDIARRVEDGLVPIFQSQDGFKAYSVATAGDQIISFSAWSSEADADAANATAADWVRDNLAGKVELKEAMIGEILLSTTLGVTTKAGTA